MDKLDLVILKEQIERDLTEQKISGRILLDRLGMLDEDSRKTAPYLDHRYAPFYYYLGKYIQPLSLAEFGFTLGLPSACLLQSCKSINKFLGVFIDVPKDGYYSAKIGRNNVRKYYKGQADFYQGQFYEEEFLAKISPNSWDLTIINDEAIFDKHLEYLETAWNHLSDDGLIVSEYIDYHVPAKEAFYGFCESKNRKPLVFKTRYGTGIVQK